MDLTDEPWARLEPLIPSIRSDPRGRPRRDPREGLDGNLWILLHWSPMEKPAGSVSSKVHCHRWHQKRSQEGVFEEILLALAEDLRDRGGFDIREAFIDGSF